MNFFKMKLYRDPGDASGGGTTVAPSVSSPPAAPSAAPAVPAAPAAPASPAVNPAAATPPAAAAAAPASTPAASATPRRIDSMPDMNSQDFIREYHRLSEPERAEVDASVSAIRAGTQQPQGSAAVAAKAAADAAAEAAKAALPGDDTSDPSASTETTEPEIGSDELEALEGASEAITPEVLATLPENVQKALAAGKSVAALVRHLDGERQKYGQFATPQAQDSLAFMAADPVISQRMQQLAKGGGYVPPAQLASLFDPSKIGTEAELKPILDMISVIGSEDAEGNPIPADPAKIKTAVQALVKKAFLEGARTGDNNARTEAQAQLRQQQLKAHVDNSLLAAAEKYPELKSNDPSVTDPWDKRHPLNPVLEFAKKNEMGKLFTDKSVKNPGEVVIAAYQAANGGLQKAFKATHDNAIRSVIRNVEKTAKEQALTVGRTTSTAPQAPIVSTIPGGNVDMDRLLRDPAGYGTRLYNEAMGRGDQARADAIYEATKRRQPAAV